MACKGVVGESTDTCITKQVEWEIKFSTLSTDTGIWYRNDYFSFADEKWCLRIYAGGQNKESQEYISVFLQSSPDLDYECNVKYTLGLKTADGCTENVGNEVDFTFNKGCVGHGYDTFFQRSKLLERKSELLPYGVLTVVCTLRQGDLLNVTPPPESMKLREIEKLSKNFQDLLVHKKSCDVTLEVKGKAFKVHKSVLIARSPVFCAMFEHQFSEKKTGTVVIPDCDEQSFDLFLEYLYSGTVSNVSFTSALRLYPTAHKYDVPELKSFCLMYLTKNLTVRGVIDAVILADHYDEAKLMSSIQDFFNMNLNEIVSTKEWENLMKENYRLANKLIVAMSSKVKIQDESVDCQKGMSSNDKVQDETAKGHNW